MLARHLDLVIVGSDNHVFAVLYHPDLARHPNVQILSEVFQDRHIRFSTDFSNNEAPTHKVTQHLDWQLQTMRYSVVNIQPNALGPLVSNILHGLTLRLTKEKHLSTMPRSRLSPTPPCSYETVSPIVQLLDFTAHVIAYWGIRKVFRASTRIKAVWAAV